MSQLKIKTNNLVAALFDEMNRALRAIESGDYHQAFMILEDRCRPSMLIEKPASDNGLVSMQIEKDILESSGIPITEVSRGPFEMLAIAISGLKESPVKEIDTENLLATMDLASDFGVNLELNKDQGID